MPRKRHLTPGSSPSAGEHSNSCLASQGELLQRDNHEPLQPPPTHSTCLTYPQASQISQRASRPSSQTSWQCPRLILQQSGEGHDLKILNFDFMGNAQRVRQCSKCPGDTEYCCISCPCDLCHQCKENHVKDLKTIDHYVVKYREKYNNNPNHEISVRHTHSSHRTGQMDISSLNVRGETRHETQRQVFDCIKNNRLFYLPFLLKGIKADIKICHTKFYDFKLQMLEWAEQLKNLIDSDLRYVDYKHECLKQKILQRLFCIQKYEHKYEHSAISLLQYFLFIKKSRFTKIHLYARTMTESLNKGNVMDSLLKIQIMERRKRCTEIEYLLKQMSGPELQQAYIEQKQQCTGTIITIRNVALLYRPTLMTDIKVDVKFCHIKLSPLQSEILTKAQTLKHLIGYVLSDLMCNVFCDFDFKRRYLKQRIKMIRHIVRLRRYEHRYEQPAITFSALQFLSFTKTALPQIHFSLHASQLSMTESLNKEDVMKSLSAIQITERGIRCVGNQYFLKLMPSAEIHHSLKVTGVGGTRHISCETPERFWVSDKYHLILKTLTDDTIYHLRDICDDLNGGVHTVNSDSELLYIDRNYNIIKLSRDMKITTTFIEKTKCSWRPICVYWSPSTGDLLVGMCNRNTKTAKVTRYNQSGQLTQTIQNNNTGLRLYSGPHYITENNNGDVVVSDYGLGAVVVTERGGRHRFSYTGHPSGSRLWAHGICTDELSHILVCDHITKTVQIMNKDGQFLSHLLTKSQEMGVPWSLSYDVNTHRLWVGSGDNNKVCVYRYITRRDALTDGHIPRPDGDTRYTTPQHNSTHQLNKNEHRPCPDEGAMSSSTPAV